MVFDTSSMQSAEGRSQNAAATGDSSFVLTSDFCTLHFEAVVSFAATVCWEWCRQRGERLIVAVAGGSRGLRQPDGTGEAHRILEAWRGREPTDETNTAALLEQLTARPLPAAALVVIGTSPSRLADTLSQRLHRPAVFLKTRGIR